MADYNFPPDLVDKTEIQLYSLGARNRIPHDVLFREWERRRAEREAQAEAARVEAERQAAAKVEAERERWRFADARDALTKCGYMPGVPTLKDPIRPIDGPWVNAQLDQFAALLQRQAQERQDCLRPLAEGFGWNLEHATKRDPETMRTEAAGSATHGSLIVKGFAKDWDSAKKKAKKTFLDWLPPEINRHLSRRGKYPK